MTEFSSYFINEGNKGGRKGGNHFANATYLLIADLESSSSESGSLKRKRIERKVS